MRNSLKGVDPDTGERLCLVSLKLYMCPPVAITRGWIAYIAIQPQNTAMGNLFSSLRINPGNLLDIRGSCQAEGVNWSEACELGFLPNGTLFSIGNITKGNLDPDSGIAGEGVSGNLPCSVVDWLTGADLA